MTPNRSLALSVQLRDLLRQNLLSVLHGSFPFEAVQAYQAASEYKGRDRVFTPENTLLAMVVSATQEDRSLQQAVHLFAEVHQRGAERLSRQPEASRALPRSKLAPISENTAAFSKARTRLAPGLVDAVFRASGDFAAPAGTRWHGLEVYITDGTYFQTQDTPALRAAYTVDNKQKQPVSAFPQGLLQGIVRLATGAVTDVRLSSRHVSELELVYPMVASLPAKSLLLADDLYNSYAIFAQVCAAGVHLIVPGKRKRNYRVVERLAEGDELVELRRTRRPAWLPEAVQLPEHLLLRRIMTSDKVFYTTLTDRSIPAADIVAQYLRRWDIEITIREVKVLMGMAVARSKTPEMVEKEFKAALIAYNLLRRVIANTAEQGGFPPEANLIQAILTPDQALLRDKKGRLYARWSPGRYGDTRRPPAPT